MHVPKIPKDRQSCSSAESPIASAPAQTDVEDAVADQLHRVNIHQEAWSRKSHSSSDNNYLGLGSVKTCFSRDCGLLSSAVKPQLYHAQMSFPFCLDGAVTLLSVLASVPRSSLFGKFACGTSFSNSSSLFLPTATLFHTQLFPYDTMSTGPT